MSTYEIFQLYMILGVIIGSQTVISFKKPIFVGTLTRMESIFAHLCLILFISVIWFPLGVYYFLVVKPKNYFAMKKIRKDLKKDIAAKVEKEDPFADESKYYEYNVWDEDFEAYPPITSCSQCGDDYEDVYKNGLCYCCYVNGVLEHNESFLEMTDSENDEDPEPEVLENEDIPIRKLPARKTGNILRRQCKPREGDNSWKKHRRTQYRSK